MDKPWEFKKFDKIPRLRRSVVVTEKIDGTNAQISIMERIGDIPFGLISGSDPLALRDITRDSDLPFIHITQDGVDYVLLAGSRKRWLTTKKSGDNYGFGRWVSENRDKLLGLGVGRHFGEWWGQGIQRRYHMDKKVFSLFNTGRWNEENPQPDCCRVVPVLERGAFNNILFETVLDDLRANGSTAAPGFMRPEGIIVYMAQARRLFKITLENDEVPKSLPKPKKATTILKTSEEWAKDYPVTRVVDPDGWDRENFQYSFYEERITHAEFMYRLGQSTVTGGFA